MKISNGKSLPGLVALLVATTGLFVLAACHFGPAPAQPTPTPSATLAATATATPEPPSATQVSATATTTPAPLPTDTPLPRTSTPPPSTTGTRVPAPPTLTPRPPAAVSTHTPVPPAVATRVPTRRPTVPPTAAAPPTATPAPPGRGGVVVLASGYGNPDDLIVAPSGDIYFGDFGNGAINVLRPGGGKSVVATGLKDPEGIAIARDGALIVAEQTTNRIIEIDQNTGAKKVLRQLVNNTGQDGADGVSLDPSTGDILIPDSPNGRILRMSRDGTTLTTIATGFVRPTGIAVESGGSMIVADEFGNEVYRLSANGTKTRLAHVFQPDDIALGPDGSIYANSLGGDIVRIDPASGRMSVLASGLNLPHGLGVDPNGNVVVAESGRNRLLRIAP